MRHGLARLFIDVRLNHPAVLIQLKIMGDQRFGFYPLLLHEFQGDVKDMAIFALPDCPAVGIDPFHIYTELQGFHRFLRGEATR